MTSAARTLPAPHRSLLLPRAVVRRLRPAVTGAVFGGLVGVVLAGGGMDPVAAVAASTGFGLAAGLLVPAREGQKKPSLSGE